MSTQNELREKVTFAPNIPTQVQLESTLGQEQPSRNGTAEYRYFLRDHRIMWVPADVHRLIQATEPRNGDLVTITRSQASAKAPASWTVEPGASREPLPTERSQPPAPRPQPKPERQAPQHEAEPTTADQLALCLQLAIDAAQEAKDYAEGQGFRLEWQTGDIRALATTLYIQACGGKGGSR
jgi:hypothetical protein